MKTRASARALLGVIASLCAFVPSTSHAGPSNAEVESAFSYFGTELRGMTGAAPSFGKTFFLGADGHVLIEGEHVAGLLGGRLVTDASSRQVAVVDLGGRYFLRRQVFAGGGGFYGAEYVDGLAFVIGHVGGVYLEGGMDLPRAWQFRMTAALRLDLGYAAKANFSRIEPPPFFTMVSLNVGVFFGGAGTAVKATSPEGPAGPAMSVEPVTP